MNFLEKIKNLLFWKRETKARATDYLQSSQYILNKCFVNNTLRLKTGGFYSVQDYLNAVFDESNDSLRVYVEGGGGVTIGTDAKNYNSDGTNGQMSYNGGYFYVCVVAGTGGSGRWIRLAAETAGF